LVPDDKSRVDVGVDGVAGEALALDGAECPPSHVHPGAKVQVTRFDPAGNRYRVEAEGSCGWVPADSLGPDGAVIDGLPWAG
jgi:hypothetical protein